MKTLSYKESRLKVLSDKFPAELQTELERVYNELERYITINPFFGISYEPVEVKDGPEIVSVMALASKKAGVGPMAAVAGAIAESIGELLLENGATDVIVENGGDIFLKLKKPREVGIHAGPSVFSNKLAFLVKPDETPVGICTSSASVGHSISLGESDAVIVVAKSASMADAAATAIANEVKGENAIERGIERAKTIPEIQGVLIIKGDKLGTWGKLPKLVRKDFNL